jgi:hypothetical protein
MADPQSLPAYQAQIQQDLRGPDLPGSLNDLAVGYRTTAKELATLKANPGIKIPGPDAKPEEVQAFHKALGVPDNPDGYGIKPPEGMPEAEVKAFVAAAHKRGYTKTQVEEALTFYQGSVKRALEAHNKSRVEQTTVALAALKAAVAGGDEAKFKAISEQVARLIKLKGGPTLEAELLNASKEMPETFKFLVKEVVPLFKEDGSPVGGHPGGNQARTGEPTPEELRKAYPNSPHMFRK